MYESLGSSLVLVSSLPFFHGALELLFPEDASLLTPVAIMTEFEDTAVVAVATPRNPLFPTVGRRWGGLLLCRLLLLLDFSVVFFARVFSKSYMQSYVMKSGLLVKSGFLVDVLANTLQNIVGCLQFSVRAGLRAFVVHM